MKNIENRRFEHAHDDYGHSHTVSESYDELLVMAIESLLIESGMITMEEVDNLIDMYVNDMGPMHGARIIAKAWKDPEYKRRLLQDGKAASIELDLESELIVLENTPDIHNVVVCTLCSCYPRNLLGLPPNWYKSTAYRSRVVVDPRSVLKEFGVELDDSVEIRVWDSNAEIRYLVLPEPPQGIELMSEEELVPFITRDAMVGVAQMGTLVPASV
jgi:nitrile hydratase